MSALLTFNQVSKNFPGVQALDSISFGIEKGSVHGLIGENGAGKSTLLKILSGYYISNSGNIEIEGVKMNFFAPFDAIKYGVRVIHQELQLVANQTVAENITLGKYASKYKFIRWKKMFSEVESFLQKHMIDINPKAKISELSIGQQQMVEIVKALYHDAKIIAFDEPTSSLSKFETDILFNIIHRLKKAGKGIIYVSHRLKEIFELCNFCTVLKDGQHVMTENISKKSLSRDDLITVMTGKKIQDIYGYRKRTYGKIVLRTKKLKGKGVISPVDMTVKSGEIVGLFGLVGAGRSELVRLIYGVEVREGTISLSDRVAYKIKPKYSIEEGLMFCTENRKKDGIINGRSIWENINISARRHYSYGKLFLNKAMEFQTAMEQKNALSIKISHLYQDIVHLSGGNQQKVILARWLSEQGMKILIIDEPTRGIDVGAKFEIYNILYSLAESGVGIIMVSSDISEIMGVCDRLYIMREGSISKELERKNFTEEKILKYAFPYGGE